MGKYINEIGVDIIEGKVISLILENKTVKGIILENGKQIFADSIIICTGTFLRSKTMKGSEITSEGPDGKPTSTGISKQFEDLGVELIRLKTGTPPRIKMSSINFDVLEEEPGSDKPIYFIEDETPNKKYQNIPA